MFDRMMILFLGRLTSDPTIDYDQREGPICRLELGVAGAPGKTRCRVDVVGDEARRCFERLWIGRTVCIWGVIVRDEESEGACLTMRAREVIFASTPLQAAKLPA